jgi:hypothetical protein
MSEDLLLQFMHKAAKEHATPLIFSMISSISFQFPKDDCFNFVESTGLGEAGRA